jgi:large subunit ribosomal protein L17
VHNRRQAARRISDKEVLAKLFTDIAVRFRDRPGGYTRVVKLGQRYGDASEMVVLELVDGAAHGEADGSARRRTGGGGRPQPAARQAEPADDA